MTNDTQPQPQLQPCRRPGCTFDRAYLKCDDGSYRRQRNCSAVCRLWFLRAKRAAKRNDVEEAAELLRLAALLDARRSPREKVPGFFKDDEVHA
ncbi:hypothetical protein [Streptomyces sp. NPDC087317]|uniref:hypothetical protein n=1 Tax=Streptomyces sp. NPDC087317 TaxID=3365784 RepID=UPI0037F6A9F7